MEAVLPEPAYLVRLATAADIDSVVALVNRAFEIEKFFKSGDRTDAAEVAAMLRLGKILLLASGNRTVSCVFVKQTGDRLYAGMLASDPDFRLPGVGARLMDATEDYARASACKWLDIRIVSVRPELKRLYRRRGFVETGTAPAHSIATATQAVHFITMSKPL